MQDIVTAIRLLGLCISEAERSSRYRETTTAFIAVNVKYADIAYITDLYCGCDLQQAASTQQTCRCSFTDEYVVLLLRPQIDGR